MSRASDRTLHTQMAHFAEQVRAAIVGERVIIIGEFHDDEIDKPANLMVFADKIEDEERSYTAVAHALCQAAQTILALTTFEIVMRDKRTGELIDFDVDQPRALELVENDEEFPS